MSITFTCDCGQRFETSDDNKGRRAHCADCGRELIIPRGGEPLLDPTSEGAEFAIGDATSRKAIAALLLGIASVFCCYLTGIPAIICGALSLGDRSGRGRLPGQGMALAGIGLGVFGCLETLLFLNSAREAAHLSHCVNNFKQIALAMHDYNAGSGSYNFPPAAIVDQDGKPLLSWRVTILPFVGEQSLFNEFHLNEPWDSLHNKALLPRMPSVYRCPSEPPGDPSLTNYQAIVGPHAMFENNRGVSLSEITDGTSNTIMVAESRNLVPWTKPEDLIYDPDGSFRTITVAESKHFDPSTKPEDIEFEPNEPLPAFGSKHSGRFIMAFADGSARIRKNAMFERKGFTLGAPARSDAMPYGRPLTGEQLLKALITRDGGEVVSTSSY